MDNVTITRCVLENLIADQLTDFAMNETSYETIKEALKKQIPLPPYDREFPTVAILCCPRCGKDLELHPNFCSECGQAIDWSE